MLLLFLLRGHDKFAQSYDSILLWYILFPLLHEEKRKYQRIEEIHEYSHEIHTTKCFKINRNIQFEN
ncbi:hypothetical protein HZH68_013246 [Vespula germanica]|uniref:Uncharacterized protein n=1 Tax=Vespula germanica TaxID=30212 RepID=A0A834JFG3_VESGE|nr:hypothetical protein HZH68_013246 [Vespula germanica]